VNHRSARLVVTAAVVLVVALGVRVGLGASLNLASQALTPYRTCVITGTPTTTAAVRDASVRQASATSNFGTSTTNNVATASSANRRLYLWFDLTQCSPTIAASATVRLATLRIYATGVATVCRTVDLFRVTASWTEAGITWNNQPFGTAINNPASGSASDSFTIGTPAGCQNQSASAYIANAIITSDVAAFVTGSATNNGWMLRDDVEGSATSYTETFSAKDLGTVSQAPQLVITYVAVP
jgi:hypothetical protein